MKITLIDHTQNPEITIGRAAAYCYDSDTSDEASIRRAAKCKDVGHLATMRFAYATISVEGISRICSHQVVRMAHAGILQRSQRYVRHASVEVVTPPSFSALPEPLLTRWWSLQDECESLYHDLMANGIRKEDARYALLHATTTRLHLCLNFQGWTDFLRNRTDKAAQWEVRNMAVQIERKLHEIAPNLFGKDSTND